SEPLSEFPIDLLIFHFLVPWAISLIRPKRLFRFFVETWYRFAARQLRLTAFLFGGRHRGEESEDEEDEGVEIVYHEREGVGAQAVEEAWDDEGWVDEEVVVLGGRLEREEGADEAVGGPPVQPVDGAAGPLAEPSASSSSSSTSPQASSSLTTQSPPDQPPSRPPRRSKREFPYMRVPNRDVVEVVPGQPMLVPMRRGEPVRGREGETEDAVRANWTKVYVPGNFRARVIALLIWQWVSGLLLTAAVVVGP
ncbi:hypothetical protein HK104_008041, partial [Borealophlyctis nickersoniae]